jgi:hypothetical protein
MVEDDKSVLACSAMIAAAAGVISLLITEKGKKKHCLGKKCVRVRALFVFSSVRTCILNAGFILYGINYMFVTVIYVVDFNT